MHDEQSPVMRFMRALRVIIPLWIVLLYALIYWFTQVS